MEIQGSGLKFSLDANIAAAMDLMRLSARRRPREPEEENLASLVMGSDASRESVFEFRRKLLEMLVRLDDVDRITDRLPELRPEWARGPHFRSGPVVWVPPSNLPASVLTTSSAQASFAEKLIRDAFERDEHSQFSIQRGKLTMGKKSIRTDDKVDLTWEGLNSLQDPQTPVAVLRLPPRYPTLGGILKVVSAKSSPGGFRSSFRPAS